jgi:hypothetical protein
MDLDEKIKEIENQICYWNQQVFVTSPNDMEQLKTTITALEYVLYNYRKMKDSNVQSIPKKEV